MGLVIIFALVTLLCAFSTIRSMGRKNLLATGFSGASVLVFGWFTIMTFIGILGGHGAPGGH